MIRSILLVSIALLMASCGGGSGYDGSDGLTNTTSTASDWDRGEWDSLEWD